MADETLNLLQEADYVINDISFSVKVIALSKLLKQTPSLVYFNIITKEDQQFTVRLTAEGFQVVSHERDKDEGSSPHFPVAYETVYALLEHISPSYVNSFGNALFNKLSTLKQLDEGIGDD